MVVFHIGYTEIFLDVLKDICFSLFKFCRYQKISKLRKELILATLSIKKIPFNFSRIDSLEAFRGPLGLRGAQFEKR